MKSFWFNAVVCAVVFVAQMRGFKTWDKGLWKLEIHTKLKVKKMVDEKFVKKLKFLNIMEGFDGEMIDEISANFNSSKNQVQWLKCYMSMLKF